MAPVLCRSVLSSFPLLRSLFFLLLIRAYLCFFCVKLVVVDLLSLSFV